MKKYFLLLTLIASQASLANTATHIVSFESLLNLSPASAVTWIPLICQTYYFDLPRKTQVLIVAKATAQIAIADILVLGAIQLLFNTKPFTTDWWIDASTNTLKNHTIVYSTVAGFRLQNALSDHIQLETPEYTAKHIDQAFLEKMYSEASWEDILKEYNGDQNVMIKLLFLNKQLKTLIFQFNTIEKYQKDKNVILIRQNLEMMCNTFDAILS